MSGHNTLVILNTSTVWNAMSICEQVPSWDGTRHWFMEMLMYAQDILEDWKHKHNLCAHVMFCMYPRYLAPIAQCYLETMLQLY